MNVHNVASVAEWPSNGDEGSPKSARFRGFWYNGGIQSSAPGSAANAPRAGTGKVQFPMLSDNTPQLSDQDCLYCKQPIPAARLRTSAVKYCSNKCQNLAYRETAYSPPPAYEDLSRGTIGAVHELIAAADLMRRGYHVFRAMSPSSPADLIAYKDAGRILRIEVRTGRRRKDGQLTYLKKNVDAGRNDVYAVVTHEGEVAYVPDI